MGTMNGEEVGQEPSGSCEEKIVVLVRLRPLNDKEIGRNDASDWECVNDNTIIFKNNLSFPDRSMYPTAYTFDRVFRSDCSTRQVYEEGAKEVALSVIDGVNASIFAYGQTSSGKTHTMSGITQYAVTEIYDHIERHPERAFTLKFSALEIYNESVRDLLSLDGTPRRLLDDPERGTVVERLTEETVRDWSHLQELLSVCEAQRQIGETSLNETSSRSHQIIRLTIESSNREFLGNESSSTLTATVNFVDLAGSERASQTLSAGARLKEGCHINRSLLTLGTVIRKLSKGRNGHVPFRDSKLTRILQSSLGGNAKSCIICTISPARSHVEQSRNTLLFGSCAKEVTTNAQVNIVMSDKALVKHLQREVARLESLLTSSWPNAITPDSAALLRDKDVEIEKLKEEVTELSLQRNHAQFQVEDLIQLFGNNKPSITWEGFDQNHPQLQVEKSWEDVNSVSDAYLLDVGVNKLCTTSYSTGYSRSNSDDNYPQIPIHQDNFMPDGSMPLISTPKSLRANSYQDQGEVEEQLDENLEAFCKEVQCIEVDRSSMTRCVSSDEENAGALALTYGERANQEPMQPQIDEDKEFSCIHPACSVPSPQELTPKNLKKDIVNSENTKLTRSRSCDARLMSTFSLSCLGNLGNEHTPPNDAEKDSIGRPKCFQMDLPLLNYGSSMSKLSRHGSQTSESSAAGEKLTDQVANILTHDDATCNSRAISGLEEMTGRQYEKQQGDCKETEPMCSVCIKNVKVVGLDPIQRDLGSPVSWPAEFMRLQGEIIKLWHKCNVSLVHRTFFFLIFKGDPADSIYMEVELRRLSFLDDIFSRGNHTVEDGRPLTPASRMRELSREREMLSNRMQKRLSARDRESLYLKWGIGLKSKHRRLQLAYCLWTDMENMDHIAESAMLIARVMCFSEPGEGLKEMFGLNFTPRRTRERYSWRRSIMPHL